MVDARRIAGWVTAPDGSRAVCPRCEGRAFIRLGEVSDMLKLPLILSAIGLLPGLGFGLGSTMPC